jgi:putative transposase
MAKKTSKPVGERPAIDPELIDELLKHGHGPEDVKSLLQQLTKAVVERALQGEMTEHLGYGKHETEGRNSGNSRNGITKKRLKGDFGEIELETPRDRNGEFEPRLVKKNQTRFRGFDDKILSMYARGMSTRDIQSHLQEMYGVDISPTLVSDITDGVMEDARAWQSRPLEPFYAIVFLDALFVKMRHEGRVENRAVYVAIGVTLEGKKEVLGLWTAATEGAKFWANVLTELRNRGVKDIYVACVDGLKGFPEAIASIFPLTQVQLCIVHVVRASLNYVPWKERRAAAADLKLVYRAATGDQAADELAAFESKWKKYPAIVKLWRSNWEGIVPFFSFPAELRVIVYTTNAVESLHSSLRKVIKTRGSFPNEEAAFKLLYLAVVNAVSDWDTVQNWKPALNYLRTMCEERIAEAFGKSKPPL